MNFRYTMPGDGYVHRSDGSILDPDSIRNRRVEFHPMYPGELSGTWEDYFGLRRITLKEADSRGLLKWFPPSIETP